MEAGVPLVPARLTPTSARRSAPWTFAPFRSHLPGRPKDLYALPCSRGAPCSPVNLRTRRLQKIDPSGGPNSRSTRKQASVPTGNRSPLLMSKTAARTAKTISTPAIPKKVPKAPPSETHTLLRALLKRATTKPMTAPPMSQIPIATSNKIYPGQNHMLSMGRRPCSLRASCLVEGETSEASSGRGQANQNRIDTKKPRQASGKMCVHL